MFSSFRPIILLVLHGPEDETMNVQNVGDYIKNNTASHPRHLQYSHFSHLICIKMSNLN